METSIKERNAVEFELVIDASAEELAPLVDQALRRQRARAQVKGFRPGKVPLSMLKKLYGESLVMDVLEKFIQEAYEDEVVEPGSYDIIGRPSLEDLQYKMDGDLHAVLRFGVRPKIELADLSKEKVLSLVHEIKDEEIDTRIERLRQENAELDDPDADLAIERESHVTIDMQKLDRASGSPIVGERDEDVTFFVDDERLREELRDALIGKKADATFRVDLPVDEEGEGDATPLLVSPSGEDVGAKKSEAYEVTVKSVQRRTYPELDEDFVKQVTNDAATDEEGLRTHIRTQIAAAWERQSRELLEGEIVMRMLDLHPFEVPESAVEIFLTSYVEDLQRRNEGALPDGFDAEAFAEQNRPEARRQARWMLLRDRVIEEAGLEVTDDDIKGHYVEMAGGDEEMAENFRKYYQAAGMERNLDQQLLSKKVIDILAERFDIDALEADAYSEALKARQAEREAVQA